VGGSAPDVNLPQAFNVATVLAGEGIATTVEVHPGGRGPDGVAIHTATIRTVQTAMRADLTTLLTEARAGDLTIDEVEIAGTKYLQLS
jgi:hypothetical protein